MRPANPNPGALRGLKAIAAVAALTLAGAPASQAGTPPPPTGAAGPSLLLASVRASCVPLPGVKMGNGAGEVRECAVSEFGTLGVVDGRTIHYALYCLMPAGDGRGGGCGGDTFAGRYFSRRALVVFEQAGPKAGAHPRFVRATPEIGSLAYERPLLVRRGPETFLVLPIAVDGTGHGNASEYYARRAGDWTPLEADGWVRGLTARLPPDLELRKGLWPDMDTLTATAPLYRKGDANCCPSGGEARVRLAIEDDRFVIESITLAPAK